MLKKIFISIWLLSGCVLSSAHAAEVSAPSENRALQSVAARLEYVAADYAGAVGDGGVIKDEEEYKEQLDFVQSAKKDALVLPYDAKKVQILVKAIEAVEEAVTQKKPAVVVQMLSQEVRKALKEELNWVLQPPKQLSFEKAQKNFQTLCASCHGTTGHADTVTAQQLKPPPVSFHDAEKMDVISPQLAYHTLTFGISGTSMVAFEQLSAQQRWELAFYVISLRHANVQPAADLDEKVLAWTMPNAAASKSDEELLTEIRKNVPDEALQKSVLSYVRTHVFQDVPRQKTATSRDSLLPKGPFVALEQDLQLLLEAAKKGDAAQAKNLANDVYMDEFEPQENNLRAKNETLVRELEAKFLQLRQLTKQPPFDIPAIEKTIQAIRAQLKEATLLLTTDGKGAFLEAFLGVLSVTLREGFETTLLVAFLLAFLRKSGHRKQTYLVHIGWVAAVALGVLTYIFVQVFLKEQLSGKNRELMEAISTFLALLILLPVTHSILGAKEARHWLGFLGKKLHSMNEASKSSSTGSLPNFFLLAIAFFAVYREMVETVLFYMGIVKHGSEHALLALLLGLFVGVAIITVGALIISYTGKRLNPKPVMRISSIFLGIFCVILAGQGTHALLEAGVINLWYIPSVFGKRIPTIEWLGIFETCFQGLIVQGVVVAVLIVPSLMKRIRERSPKK